MIIYSLWEFIAINNGWTYVFVSLSFAKQRAGIKIIQPVLIEGLLHCCSEETPSGLVARWLMCPTETWEQLVNLVSWHPSRSQTCSRTYQSTPFFTTAVAAGGLSKIDSCSSCISVSNNLTTWNWRSIFRQLWGESPIIVESPGELLGGCVIGDCWLQIV